MGSCVSTDQNKQLYNGKFIKLYSYWIDFNLDNHVSTRNDFNFMQPIGKGGFGKVWRVTRKADSQLFAMKEMQKARVLAKRSIHSVINERKILS